MFKSDFYLQLEFKSKYPLCLAMPPGFYVLTDQLASGSYTMLGSRNDSSMYVSEVHENCLAWLQTVYAMVRNVVQVTHQAHSVVKLAALH